MSVTDSAIVSVIKPPQGDHDPPTADYPEERGGATVDTNDSRRPTIAIMVEH